jgi:hypothetical protein
VIDNALALVACVAAYLDSRTAEVEAAERTLQVGGGGGWGVGGGEVSGASTGKSTWVPSYGLQQPASLTL